MTRERIINIVGWYGVIAVLTAYAFTSALVLAPNSVWYQILNFTGSISIAIETWHRRDYQPFWLNIIWAIIAIAAMLNALVSLN